VQKSNYQGLLCVMAPGSGSRYRRSLDAFPTPGKVSKLCYVIIFAYLVDSFRCGSDTILQFGRQFAAVTALLDELGFPGVHSRVCPHMGPRS
jgi:hypothetical protein